MLLAATLAWADEERVFSEIRASDGLADNSAQTIKCTKTGRLVISTLGNINFYEGAHFTHVDMDDVKAFPLANYHGHYHLYFDHHHHLWLKSSNGVFCVNLTLERLELNVDSVFQAMGADGRVDDMFADEDGQVWMMVKGKMLGSDCQKTFPVLEGVNLQDVDVWNGHVLMFYNSGEMMEFDLATEKVVYRGYPSGVEGLEDYGRSSVILRHGDTYFQIRNGQKESVLMQVDMRSHQWTLVHRLPYHMNNMVIYNNVLYIASEYGYWTYDIDNRQLHHQELLTLFNGRKLLTDVNTVEFDRLGGMWLGTEQRGLLYSRIVSTPFKTYDWEHELALKYAQIMDTATTNKLINEFNGKKATCLFVDSRERTWVGTMKGLEYYVSPQAEPEFINQKKGLLNNVIHSIVEDDMHNIWVATSYGISCVVMNGDTIRFVLSFSTLDNVPNETFRNGKAAKLADGTIIMQALDHVVAFNPADFKLLTKEKVLKLYPKLTRLMVNGNIVEAGEKVDGTVILTKSVTRTKTINVNYNQNTLSLLFSGLNYIRPLQTYYRVRVKGVIDEWEVMSYFNSGGKVDANGQLHLPLNSLRPGRYEIELQVSLLPDQWETEPYVWIVNVNEPWWRARGMISLLALALLLLAALNVYVYTRNVRMKMKRNTEEGDVIRRIKNFVERCDGFTGEVLAPSMEEMFGDGQESNSELSDEFIEIMTDIVSFVHERKGKQFSMHNLSELTGTELPELYEVMSANLYKSPRALARTLRLQRAADLLKTTDKSVENVAAECGFLSPNYFIANFFHKYRQTPAEYRANPS
mgnify:CR=1 FL=1